MLGGTRSGKSRHAEDLLAADAPVRYLATARRRADDAEWDARIEAHRARRPARWSTVEDPDVAALLRATGPSDPPLLVDDLSTWLTGVLDDFGAWDRSTVPPVVGRRVAELVAAVAGCRGHVVLVSAEVGLGVVPATRAGRLFRDELGAANAALAAVCDEVLLVVAGLALRLK
ncbi:MAG: bifunctional adenosylcobinamide kinase/adenosylcobinamide-phosphate guanylyltransferase [Pseudonocardia sp.]